jgi:hypothetical protein
MTKLPVPDPNMSNTPPKGKPIGPDGAAAMTAAFAHLAARRLNHVHHIRGC